jgi:hypothetical protein
MINISLNFENCIVATLLNTQKSRVFFFLYFDNRFDNSLRTMNMWHMYAIDRYIVLKIYKLHFQNQNFSFIGLLAVS